MKKRIHLIATLLFVCLNAFTANPPETLSIQGTALAESPDPMPMKLVGDNIYELYTALKTGDYSFTDAAAEAGSVTEANDMIPYRIRVDYNGETPEVTIKKVERAYIYSIWSRYEIATMTYLGNSTFGATANCPDRHVWGSAHDGDARYRARIYVDGDTFQNYASAGGDRGNGNVALSADDSQDQWAGGCFDLPEEYISSPNYFNVKLSLNNYAFTVSATTVPTTLTMEGFALNESEQPMPMKHDRDRNFYELYTTLKAGDYTIRDENNAEVAAGTIPAGTRTKVYRIRAGYSNGTTIVAAVEEIEKVTIWAPWNEYEIATLTYAGNSSFVVKGGICDTGAWGDDRFRVRVAVKNGYPETYGEASGGSPNLAWTNNIKWGSHYQLPERSFKIHTDYVNTNLPFDFTVYFRTSDYTCYFDRIDASAINAYPAASLECANHLTLTGDYSAENFAALQTALATNQLITAITVEGSLANADGNYFAAINPNCLTYVTGNTPPTNWTNVVSDNNVALTPVTITDGTPFECANPVTGAVSYTRECYNDGQWESIILPFPVETFAQFGDYTIEKFAGEDLPNKVIRFIKMNALTEWEANRAYLMKSNSVGTKATYTFSNSNATIQTDAPANGFTGLYSLGSGEGKYILNENGTAIGIGAQSAIIPAFRAYFLSPHSGAPARYSVEHDNGTTDINIENIENTPNVYKLLTPDGLRIIKGDKTYTIDGILINE